MRVYRLIKAKYADDPLDPQCAKRYGGRWNSQGMAALYASDSIALAALEQLVHLHSNEVLNRFVLCEITLRDGSIMTLAGDTLPKDWRHDPPPSSTIAIGDEWLSSGKSLALLVPSTIVPQQLNLIINPNDPGFGELHESMTVEPFVFDTRLAK
jgi:RES domain-containing protein